MNKNFHHVPVMPNEVMGLFLNLKNKTVVDATAGGGGHLRLLAEAVGPLGLVLAFDRDPRAHQDDASLGVAKAYPQVKLFYKTFSQIKTVLKQLGIKEIDGLLCDLGVSSHQLDEASRGFSFQKDGPIDMRMDKSLGLSAYEWLEKTKESEIADTLFLLGQERKSRQIAAKIKQSWPIENSTLALAKLVLSALRQKHWSKIHPATKTFQAIRMAVNGEMNELTTLLNDIGGLLAVNGVATFISFHSLEDGLIKKSFKELAFEPKDGKNFSLLTKKPLVAQEAELEQNRRARCAKLRAIKRIG